jgi:hypothetical protein
MDQPPAEDGGLPSGSSGHVSKHVWGRQNPSRPDSDFLSILPDQSLFYHEFRKDTIKIPGFVVSRPERSPDSA